ncbi:amino-acid racemase [Flavobacterium aquidurense]|jgi:predicted amino acid racemase|uniref:alanine/ornithine racemase family PLP-dependent enzyme n=1 Tax=Flavobacterium aquidurense TaxID=362413 RepID=UPI00092291A1|nr:alanine/ornithine racemase family PLP-dependent enzyme [Flavobacterium aquidurense]OXA72056.1 amino-acid racemase [Flavobacterium aquidurense]SHH61743.1 Predicted amino acid racemase [Flavobacterium frigidimaris]
MAFIKLYRKKLKENYTFLNSIFESKNIQWGVVSKLLCGNKLYLKEIISLGVKEIHDSRVSNLKKIKSLDPTIQTVYIKPPAKRSIVNIVKYADVSFNTELYTIQMLSEEAQKQNKIHKIIIMIEMGDLREGVMGEDLIEFYGTVINMPNIEIRGIGTNLNCLSGVMPTQDKLIQLSLYKQLIEAKFNITIPWVSGGTSVAIPLLLKNARPMAVNHFRIGEALFFGKDLFTGETIKGMHNDVFKLFAEIIEITEKPDVPTGELGENVAGNTFSMQDTEDFSGTSLRAILDIGLLDMQPQYLEAVDEEITIVDASSDMLVIDISSSTQKYKVGDLVSFNIKYMGALYLLNSNYIEKNIE